MIIRGELERWEREREKERERGRDIYIYIEREAILTPKAKHSQKRERLKKENK